MLINKKPLISYILPAYQAESFIYNSLRAFSKYCADSDLSSEIIVVNDGSTDRTNEVIETYIRENKESPIKYISLSHNIGKGFAIKKAVEKAEGKYIVFTDCDLPYSFENINNVVRSLVNNTANIIIASRMHKKSVYKIRSENLSYIYIRHTSGRVYNWLINLLTRLNMDDTQAGLKGFDRDTAKLIFEKMTINGFSFDVDILVCAKEHGRKISTVPINFNYDAEMSTINFIKQTFVMTLGILIVFFKRITGYYTR